DLGSHTDEELVEMAQTSAEGDLRAFDTLVSRHQARVLANCRYLTRSPDDAEDLAQEVFIKGYFGLARFEGRSQFKTWIQRIKVNHCLNHIRKQKDKVHLDVQDAAMEAEPDLQVAPQGERRAEASDERELVRAVLDILPDTLRVPLILRDLDGLSYQEIADSLEIGLSATKMRIKRGREEFRAAYEKAKQSLEMQETHE
ncbi:MAG: RNA polymerase sigma factor, partial [Gemmatimonadetes bacterium]|nr:RNA polymerase sigma factor [Gemmatimonadota bacterium]